MKAKIVKTSELLKENDFLKTVEVSHIEQIPLAIGAESLTIIYYYIEKPEPTKKRSLK